MPKAKGGIGLRALTGKRSKMIILTGCDWSLGHRRAPRNQNSGEKGYGFADVIEKLRQCRSFNIAAGRRPAIRDWSCGLVRLGTLKYAYARLVGRREAMRIGGLKCGVGSAEFKMGEFGAVGLRRFTPVWNGLGRFGTGGVGLAVGLGMRIWAQNGKSVGLVGLRRFTLAGGRSAEWGLRSAEFLKASNFSAHWGRFVRLSPLGTASVRLAVGAEGRRDQSQRREGRAQIKKQGKRWLIIYECGAET
jgi:hypothetical protein